MTSDTTWHRLSERVDRTGLTLEAALIHLHYAERDRDLALHELRMAQQKIRHLERVGA
jgi:hypothetical protein